MPILKRGILIALEGIDGSGKTLLANTLVNALTKNNFLVYLTREPGGTSFGNTLRTILQKKMMPIHPKAEYLLFASDRAQHFKEVIIPELQCNKIVLSDRLADSSVAYQGYGHGLDITMIKTINQWTMNDIEPDMIIYNAIDMLTAQKRTENRGNQSSFDQETTDFFKRILAGYDTELSTRSNVLYVDGTQPIEQLTQHALESIIQWINKNNLLQH